MTVRELIDRLSKCDPDAILVQHESPWGFYPVRLSCLAPIVVTEVQIGARLKPIYRQTGESDSTAAVELEFEIS